MDAQTLENLLIEQAPRMAGWLPSGDLPLRDVAIVAVQAWNRYDATAAWSAADRNHAGSSPAVDDVLDVVDGVWPYALGAGELYAQREAVRIWRREVGKTLAELGHQDRTGPVGQYLHALDAAAAAITNASISPTRYGWSQTPSDHAYTIALRDLDNVYRADDAEPLAHTIRAVWQVGHHDGRIAMASIVNQIVPRDAEKTIEDATGRAALRPGTVDGMPLYRWVERVQDTVLTEAQVPPPAVGGNSFPQPTPAADTGRNADLATAPAWPMQPPHPGRAR